MYFIDALWKELETEKMQMRLQLMLLEKERDDMRQIVKMEYEQKFEMVKKEKDEILRENLESSAKLHKEKDVAANTAQRDLEKRCE